MCGKPEKPVGQNVRLTKLPKSLMVVLCQTQTKINFYRGMRVRNTVIRLVIAAFASCAIGGAAMAGDEKELTGLTAKKVTAEDGRVTQEGSKFEDGKWILPDDSPTFSIKKDKGYMVDWFTYNGYRRYHAECHVCHGPDGEGSTYAPRLADSLQTMSYDDFVAVVSGGRTVDVPGGGESVMPAFGDNKNVMCFVDDLYTYLKARALEALPRGKLGGRNREKKPEEARVFEKECFGD